ncbi:FecR family protein [Algoriphagus winogradskyi]|uniref:FecR family protein n=1 Tax=Algoriphagus winogradskyi TaxID=237017 RepID=A0ABY1NBH5_9BACT|nr:FecR family protein [Algoriphagus winogradskyi]SMP05364.1 FecR family protein [Algoriphagus winogradskyi]
MNKNQEFNNFFEGKMSKVEAAEFSAWLDTTEGKIFLESKLESNWSEESTKDYADWDKSSLLEKINEEKSAFNLENEKPITKPDLKGYSKRASIPIWYKVAAILIFILGVPFIFQKITSTDSVPEVAQVQIKQITRSNPAGVKSKFQLPDGSMVSLNSESSIVYAEDFAVNRNLELIGEAYINVAKDSLHPFVVKSLGLNTEALGTIFNVKAYENESKVEVLLVEGKVRVNHSQSNEAFILEPGEKAVLATEQDVFEKKKGDITRETQWTSGVLEFRNFPFEDIFKNLERWYGVKFEVKGNINKAKGVGKFQEGETLENVLEVLSYSNHFNYRINRDTVFVNFTKE